MFAKLNNNNNSNSKTVKQKSSKAGLVRSTSAEKSSMQLKIEKLKLAHKSKDGKTPTTKKSSSGLKGHTSATNAKSCGTARKCIGKGDERNDVSNLLTNAEIGIQTVEEDILKPNEEAAVIMHPSRRILALVHQWRKQKLDDERRQLLRQVRVFGKENHKKEQHITNLNEFLEKGSITKKNKQKIPIAPSLTSFFDKHKPQKLELELEKSSSNLSTKKSSSGIEISPEGSSSLIMTETESYSEINGRIRKKEDELLGLLDTI